MDACIFVLTRMHLKRQGAGHKLSTRGGAPMVRTTSRMGATREGRSSRMQVRLSARRAGTPCDENRWGVGVECAGQSCDAPDEVIAQRSTRFGGSNPVGKTDPRRL